MGRLAPVELRLDVSDARRQVKKVLREAEEANRVLARLEDRLDEYSARLAEFGIKLEVDPE